MADNDGDAVAALRIPMRSIPACKSRSGQPG
jgi:hypothetical protein